MLQYNKDGAAAYDDYLGKPPSLSDAVVWRFLNARLFSTAMIAEAFMNLSGLSMWIQLTVLDHLLQTFSWLHFVNCRFGHGSGFGLYQNVMQAMFAYIKLNLIMRSDDVITTLLQGLEPRTHSCGKKMCIRAPC